MKLTTIALALELVLPFCAVASADEFERRGAASSGAMTPFPMQVFCSKKPSECQASRSASAEWNPKLAELLELVNDRVNSDIRPKANPNGGWKINPAYGDCNDYALTKRSRLIRLGVPPGALRIAVTATRDAVPHTILIVKTSNGDVVLDNLSAEVKTLRRSGYSIRLISTANPMRWTRG